MPDLKDTLRGAIERIATSAEARYSAEESRDLSQAALNLSATLGQIVNIEIAEETQRLHREAHESGEFDTANGPVIH